MAPNRQKSQKTTASATSFDEAALTKLTAKIDKNLSASSGKQDGKRKRQPTEHSDSRNPPKKRAQSQSQRPINGKSLPKQQGQSKSEELLAEIKALGGDEADLDLVVGIDSDAEEGQEKKPERPLDKDFKSQLAQFASGLGFEKVRDAAVEAPDSEGAEGDGDEAEEDGEEEEAEEVPVSKPKVDPEQTKSRKPGKLTFEPRPDWHAVDQQHLPAPSPDDIRNFSGVIAKLKSFANELLEADALKYRETVTSSSSRKFMSTIMSSGTMSDRVSALTLEIQESPVHNIKAFDSLVGLAGKKSRGQAMAALAALVDLLGNGVALPSDRRLRTFHSQPGLLGTMQSQTKVFWKSGEKLPGKLTEQLLIVWAFEDWLKDAYFKIIQLLEAWAADEIEYSRSRSLDFIFGLLKEKPEQEANLLRLLVNKLGDRDRKIASRASFLILQLLNIHPAMNAIVIGAVEQEVLLRPGQSQRAKYYAISTLNQTILSSKDPSVADTLVRIYFELFLTLLKSGALGAMDVPASEKLGGDDAAKGKPKRKPRQEKVDDVTTSERATAEKLTSAILTGINRAIPFAMTDESTLEEHLGTLFRVTHSSNFNTSIQALMLIQQVAVSKHMAVDRYFRTLYESLLDPRLITSSKQALYLNLLFRSLKNDVDVRRVKAFVKRMLQVVNLHQPSFMCGILYLVAELESTFPDLKTLLSEPEEDNDDEEEVYEDVVNGNTVNNAGQPPHAGRRQTAYDGRKRDPEYSNAQRSCLWELMPYFEHFHPTVAAFASNLLVPQASLPKPDLASHTLMHFLDKFVYRNPKATESKRGASIMQPILGSGSSAHIVAPGKASAKQQPSVNSAAFWNKKAEDVAAEDIFFHEYFSQIGKPSRKGKEKKAVKEAAEDDSEAEEEVWQALVDSRPEIEGDEGDVDMDMDDDDDDDDLGSLLDMSDDDDDDDDDDDESVGDEGEAAASDGGVEFVDFSDEDGSEGKAKDRAATKSKSKDGKLRRKELKALPTFASAEDYAQMLAGEVDEDYT